MASNSTASRDQNVFYESTPDGDIRTIVKENVDNGVGNNGSFDNIFQQNLHKSWDDQNDGLATESVDVSNTSAPPIQQQQKPRHGRHKHNLSVQFFDMSMSDDLGQTKRSDDLRQKEAAALDVNVPPPPAESDPSPGHQRTKSGLEVEAAAAYYFNESDEDEPSPAKNDDIANFQKNVHSSWESDDEGEGVNQKSGISNKSRRGSFSNRFSRHQHLSVQFTDDSFVGKEVGNEESEFVEKQLPQVSTSMSNREARASHFSRDEQRQEQPQQPPVPPAGIVVPLPIIVRPSANRKHRRVYSGRSNPAMAHRRMNTRGDSAPTKGEAWAPTNPDQFPPPPPPHPTTHPYPPPYFHQGYPPPHPYSNGSVPPTYDPYYAATQPVDPRYYAVPSPHQYNSSPPSSSGENNHDARASTVIHPTPLTVGGQYGVYYGSKNPPHYPTNSHDYPPNEPRLPEYQQHVRKPDYGVEIDKDFQLSNRSKENNNDGGNGGASHHRKQSSLGSFLAQSGFDDLFDHNVEPGYDSAPDEQQIKRHNKSLSSASFLRSLSSDNFLKDQMRTVPEDQHKSDKSSFPSSPNSASNATGDVHNRHYPVYYPYGPPSSSSQWQQPNNTLRHSPIQKQPPKAPSPQERPLFGGGTIQTQFSAPSPPPRCLEVTTAKNDQDSTMKRQRRKCSVPDCPNRVVQGGLCISHGAKRKTCAYPGCEKNVKAKGFCSTHGPARKRCNAEGCTKVAVQGGRCIAHGAKKKVCSRDGCQKQAILKGLCKKHHDETHGVVKARGSRKVGKPKEVASSEKKPVHERGLSLFTDSAIVDSIISSASAEEQQP